MWGTHLSAMRVSGRAACQILYPLGNDNTNVLIFNGFQ